MMKTIVLVAVVLLLLCFCCHCDGKKTRNKNKNDKIYSEKDDVRMSFDEAPFRWGVASGDPTASSVILWTRVEPTSNIKHVSLLLSTDANMLKHTGTYPVVEDNDYSVSVELKSLEPDTEYYYQFVTEGDNKKSSRIGRTKTAPATSRPLVIGVVSCSSHWDGWYNAYRALYQRKNVDLIIHMGDVDYDTTSKNKEECRRVPEPRPEFIKPDKLETWRQLHEYTRRDADWRQLLSNVPIVLQWDNHDVDGTGGEEAFYNWFPIRKPSKSHLAENGHQIDRKIAYGPLLDIFVVDTHLSHRIDQEDQRILIGDRQIQWLRREIPSSKATYRIFASTKTMSPWKIIRLPLKIFPKDAELKDLPGGLHPRSWFSKKDHRDNKFLKPRELPDPPKNDEKPPSLQSPPKNEQETLTPSLLELSVRHLLLSSKEKAPKKYRMWKSRDVHFDMGLWDGAPEERKEVLRLMREIGNNIVVSGDTHTALGSDLVNTEDVKAYKPCNNDASGVEFAPPSVSRGNWDEGISKAGSVTKLIKPDTLLGYLRASMSSANKHHVFTDLVNHGYGLLHINKNEIEAQYIFVDHTKIQDNPVGIVAAKLFMKNGEKCWNRRKTFIREKYPRSIRAVMAKNFKQSVKKVGAKIKSTGKKVATKVKSTGKTVGKTVKSTGKKVGAKVKRIFSRRKSKKKQRKSGGGVSRK